MHSQAIVLPGQSREKAIGGENDGILGGGIEVSMKDNLSLIDDMLASYNARDWSRFSELFAESALMHEPGMDPYRGKEAILKSYQGMLSAFPDAHMEKTHAFGQSDWACALITARGTNKGPLPGPGGQSTPPTNKTIEVELVTLTKIRDGKIIECHEVFDRLGMLTQLGLG